MSRLAAQRSDAGGAESGERPAKASQPANRPWSARWWLVIAALVAAYGGLLAATASPHASGSDQSGYLNCARLLADGQRFAPLRPVPGTPMGKVRPWLLIPLGFAPAPLPGHALPTYPPGFPLHLVAASRLVGWDAAGVAVQACAGAALLLLVCLLGQELGLRPAAGVAAALLLAAFPVTIHFFTWMMSDGLAATWCCAAVLGALLARRRPAWAAAGGFAFSVAVAVRPTDVLLLPALAVALPRRGAAWLAFAAGGAPGALLLAAYNFEVYGGVLASGYRSASELFRTAYFWPRILHFSHWLVRFLTVPVAALWLVGAAGAVRGDRRQLLLLAWFLPIVVVYAFYYHSIEAWWYLRFILPAVPAFVLAAAATGDDLAVQAAGRLSGRPARVAIALIAVLGVVYGVRNGIAWTRSFSVLRIARDTAVYPSGVRWLESRTPAGSPVVAMQFSGALFYSSERPLLRWDTGDPSEFGRIVARSLEAGSRPHALLFEFEVERLHARHPGLFVEVARRPPVVLLAAVSPANPRPVRNVPGAAWPPVSSRADSEARTVAGRALPVGKAISPKTSPASTRARSRPRCRTTPSPAATRCRAVDALPSRRGRGGSRRARRRRS